MRPSKPISPQHPRPAVHNPRPNLLNPDVLDDETRALLLREVMHPVAHAPSASPSERRPSRLQPITTPSRSPSNAVPRGKVAKVLQPQQLSAGSSASTETGAYPSQLRARVGSVPGDLVSSMAARLAELEKKHKAYQQELAEVHGMYRVANDRLQKEAKLREDAEELVVVLYEEKKKLEQELVEVRQFLSDYGLQWRGGEAGEGGSPALSPSSAARKRDQKTPTPTSRSTASAPPAKFDLYAGDFSAAVQSGNAEESRSATPTPPPRLFSDGPLKDDLPRTKSGAAPPPPDVELLRKNAKILSDYVGWQGVVMEGKRALIKARDVVSVAVYKNGICVNKGVFRPYGWALCDAFLKDLVEGFYPYEFKDKYPDGFPIEVVDYSTELCGAGIGGGRKSPQPSSVGSGQTPSPPPPLTGGRRLGGAPLESQGAGAQPFKPVSAGANVHSLQPAGYAPVSKDEFLGRIPAQKVAAGGQLVNVRGAVAALMAGAPESKNITVRHISTAEAASKAAKPETELPSPATPMRCGDLVAVQVRLPSGQRVMFSVPPASTIAVLRQELARAVPEFTKKHTYELCQAFPNTIVFINHRATLDHFGIKTTCTLMVRIITSV